MWCDNKNMLRDRVESYRNVNLYNPHYDRHVIGPLRFTDRKDSIFCFEAGYSLFQTSLEGESRLFSVGRYRVRHFQRKSASEGVGAVFALSARHPCRLNWRRRCNRSLWFHSATRFGPTSRRGSFRRGKCPKPQRTT